MSQFIIRNRTDSGSYDQEVTLDGQKYILGFDWNGRESAWYLSIKSAGGVLLLSSRKLVTNRPILQRFQYLPGLPPGELIACDPSETIDYADYDQLGPGLGVELVYFDAAELGRT